MSLYNFIENFLSLFILAILYFLIKFFWSKYFEEKGKNQATKEDIGDITTIIEKIKSDLLQQNEFLKAKLSFSNQHRINLKTAEREAIFEYNKRCSAWLYSLIRFNFSQFNLENYKTLKQVSADFVNRQYECDVASAHLFLFVNDEEFRTLNKDLNVSIIDLESIVENAMLKAYFAYSECEFDLEHEKNDFKKRALARNELQKKLTIISQDHRAEIIKQYKNVNEYHSKMIHLISKKLRNIEKEVL